MYLSCLERGHRLKHRLLLGAVKAVTRSDLPDAVKAMLYRPELFGRPFGALAQQLLRGPSGWSVGERELLAAFTSHLNHCRFRTVTHGAVASLVLGEELVQRVLESHESADVSPRLRAALVLVEQLTLRPDQVDPSAIRQARDAGLGDEDLDDAIHICFLFNLISRVADAFGFAVPSHDEARRNARILLKRGYR